MLLVITIRNLDTGTSTRFESAQSPVRIGRNSLNELVLEAGFVSQFHGVVRFGDDGIHYKDLGSTNGSTAGGSRLPRNAEVTLGPDSDLRIGPLSLEIAAKSASAVDGTTPPGAGVKHTRTLYGMLRESPGGPPRGERVSVPMSEGSSVATAPLSSNARAASDATSIARELASRLLPPGREPTTDADSRRLIEAVAVILDAFAHSFVGLRRGVEQAGSELGVRSVPNRSPLYLAKDHQQVLSHLLDTRTEPQQMAQELVGVFADFGVHQVALLNGITESVKALLVRVSGGDAAQERSGRVKLWPFRGDDQKMGETIRELLEDDRQLHAAIFGEEFGMAYAAGTMKDSSKGKP
jgi:predicted component of type VI protein secretion system